MNTRAIVSVVALLVSVSVTACSGSDDESSNTGGSSSGGKGGKGGTGSGGKTSGGTGGNAPTSGGGTSSGGSGGNAGTETGGAAGTESGGAAGTASGGAAGDGGDGGTGGSSAGGSGGTGGSSVGGVGGTGGSSVGGAGGTGGAAAGPSSTRHTKRPIGTKYAAQGYWEYLPPNPPAKSPLMVFFHGIGENGAGDSTSLDKVLANGPPKLISKDQWPNDRPFIVLSAQHPGGGCPSASEIHDFISFAIQNYAVDLKRVYLTGLSCGAIGSWSYVGQYINQQVAAFVSIAGDGQSAWNAKGCALGALPIWAFHGDQDGTVNVAGSKVPLEGLMKCTSPAAVDAKLTIYPGVGHDSWTKTYDLSSGNDIYAWLLSHTHP